ncbi:prolyl oligopeptidase family serine peptidase [Spongiibacter taiwanensis]|uniref:alpha/beta hydrolase family protein n=1 Tax=Spongiibacter taiwanensis TaxID=1748242 RepID=UPI0020359762|nr:prolyl oligopeptidase family serine peptidase [Spongiibacter taiwanensis]USA41933.1 prolyl oligopeptidase family serine peptidase [Spongiibacter taiwanensis]
MNRIGRQFGFFALLAVFLGWQKVALSGDGSLPPLDIYGHLPAISHAQLSPSGEQLGVVTHVDEKSLLLVMKQGKIRHKIGLGDILVDSLRWAGDGHLLVRTRSSQELGSRRGGLYSFSNLLTVDAASGKADWPLANSKRVFNASLGFYRPIRHRGAWYQCVNTFSLKGSYSSRFGVSCLNLESGKLKEIVASESVYDWLIDQNLEISAHATYSAKYGKWQLWKGESHSVSLLNQRDPMLELESKYGETQILGLGRRPGTALILMEDRKGVRRTAEVDIEGSAPVEFLYADVGISELFFDSLTGLHNGYELLGEVPKPVMHNAAHQARVKGVIKAFPGRNTTIVSWSNDFNRIIAYTDGAGDSGTWWTVDIESGFADELGRSYPALPPEQVGDVEVWEYKAADGLPITAILTRPPGEKGEGLPLVVIPHGGPESRDFLGFDWMAQAFASRGYVVLQPNFRGSSGFGIAFRNAGFGEWGRKMQTDISDGVNALAKTGLIDPARVSIVGASYGGYAALAGVTVQQGIYRCAVSIAGVADLGRLLVAARDDRAFQEYRYWKDYLGVDSLGHEIIEKLSPVDLAESASAPILLIHGDGDLVVPIAHSKAMAKELRAEDKPYRFVEIKTEDHYLSRSHTRRRALEESVSFVMQHNPPGGATAPVN